MVRTGPLHLKSTLAMHSLRCGFVCFQVLQDRNEIPLGCGVAVVNESISIYLALRNVVDINVEVSRLQKKRDDLIRYFFNMAIGFNTVDRYHLHSVIS